MVNVQRHLNNPNDPSSVHKNVATKGSAPTVHKALVIDVILDPLNLTDEQKQNIKDVTQSSKDGISLGDMMPANTVIGRIVSNEGGQNAQTNIIIMPWFSSHQMLPVKPGEIVNIIYDDYENTGAQMPFWVTRRSSPGTVEDVNFTHHDRIYDPTQNPGQYALADRDKTGPDVGGPGFPNGAGTDRSKTIEDDDVTGEDAYESIKKNSEAYQLHTTEPVPRFIKKPGDHVLQGSNNTLISMGQDRNGENDNEDNIIKFSGTIDIVAGRGRIMPISDDEDPKFTAPRVVINSRGELETDKSPHRKGFTNRKSNPKEGNPDFDNDAARLYVSMQTKADEKFGLQLNSDEGLKLPSLTGEGTINRSHVVAKADHVRLIARNSDDPAIKGTILLVREGLANVDLGYMYIDEQGLIQLESEKLFLGQATTETEPNIMFTNYKETILALQAQIDMLAVTLQTQFAAALTTIPGKETAMAIVYKAPKLLETLNLPNKTIVEKNTADDQHSLKTFNEPNPNR